MTNIEAAAERRMNRAGFDWSEFNAEEFDRYCGDEDDDEARTARAIIAEHGSAVLIIDEAGRNWYAPEEAESYEDFIYRMGTNA